MNGTIITEMDGRAISHYKNEIIQNKILIEKLEEEISIESTRFDEATEISSHINDLQTNIKEFEQKILTIIYKYF